MSLVTLEQTITTLPEVKEALEQLAYPCQEQDDAIVSHIAILDRKFPVLITISDNRLCFNIQVAQLQDISQSEGADDAAKALAQLLSINDIICPFATCLMDAEDGLDPGDPIILIDSVAIGDLSIGELDAEMDAARRALTQAVATIGL